MEKAEAVITAAEAEPERYSDLAQRLDEDGARVEAIHREMRQRQERAAYEGKIVEGCTVADLQALADSGQTFVVIYADPPWDYETYSERGKERSADRHYNTLDIAGIKALGPLIRKLAGPNCALFLWTTGSHLRIACDVLDVWEFKYSTVGFDWVKTNLKDGAPALDDLNGEQVHFGQGHVTRLATEPVLFASRGSPFRLANDVRQVVIAPVGEHSEKPEEVRRRIERLFSGPYLELFGRKPTPGWTVWGNEIPRGELAPPASNVTTPDSATVSVQSTNGEIPVEEMKKKLEALDIPDDLSIPPALRRPLIGRGNA